MAGVVITRRVVMSETYNGSIERVCFPKPGISGDPLEGFELSEFGNRDFFEFFFLRN